MNNKQKTWLAFVWLIAIIAAASAFLSSPNRDDLTSSKAALTDVNEQIKAQKTKHSDQAQKLQANSFNLDKAMNAAQDKLAADVKFAVGGAKNRADFDSKQDELTQQFTKSVTKQLLLLNAAGSEDPLYTKNFEFKLTDTTQAKVMFVDTSDPGSTKVEIVLTFKAEDGKAKEQNALVTLNYDLTKQQAVSGSFKQYSDNFDNTGEEK